LIGLVKARGRSDGFGCGLFGLGLLVFASGCVSDVKVDAPRMPRILPAPAAPATTVPAADPALKLAEVKTRAERGDMPGALEALKGLDLVRQRDASAIVARAMVERDLPAAVQWANAIEDVSSRVAAIRALAARLFELDPAGAMGRLQALSLGDRRIEFLSLAAAEWARRDASAALAWARAVDDATLRTRVLTSIVFEISQTSPERASELAELIPAGRDRWIVVNAIGRSWAVRNSVAALAWARRQPAGEARSAAVAGVEAGIYPPDWHVRSLPADAPIAGIVTPSPVGRPPPYGVQSDEALRREFENRLRTSPALTGDWLASLPAGERKDEFMQQLAREWLAQNPAAARQWFDQNVPSDPVRRQLLFEAGVANGMVPPDGRVRP
jgi:hypothetical protein